MGYVTPQDYGAAGNGTTDDTSAINSAISAVSSAGGGVLLFPAASYKISSALSLTSHVELRGMGSGVSVINQSSTTANGLSGVDLTTVKITGLSINGPGSGSGIGVNFDLSVNGDTTYVVMDDVRVASWGSHGVQVKSPVASRFSRVNVTSNGSDGWHVYGTGTSCHWSACYSLSNSAGIGYHLIGLSYSTLAGCAADSNVTGYSLSGCTGIAITGSGTESNSSDGYVLSGGSGNSLTSCFVYANNRYSVHVTSSEANAAITDFVEHNPAGGAVNSILVDSGCSATVINPSVVTAASYASGTTYQVTPYGASGQMWMPEDNGLLTAVGDPWVTQGSDLLTAGTLYLVKLAIRRTMTITNLWWLMQTLGSGTSTGSYCGLYSSAGTLLSGSSDIAAKITAPATTGGIFVPLTTPQAVTAGSYVWAAILCNLSTTQVTLHGADATTSQINVNLSAASYRFATNGTGLTSLPASITPSSNAQSSTGISIWAGAS